MKLRMLLLTVAACLMSSCGGGPNLSNPTPVAIMKPETRSELNLNAFLFSNGTVLGCKDYITTLPVSTYGENVHASQLKTAGTPVSTNPKDPNVPKNPNDPLDPKDPPAHEHNEPPIGGEDGSFRLYMNVNNDLLGTTPSRKKLCGQPEGKDSVHWLHWRRWGVLGNDIPTPSDPVSGSLQVVEVKSGQKVKVSFTGTQSIVEIFQVTDANGTSWNSTTSAKFGPLQSGKKMFTTGTGVGTYFDLDETNAHAIRMAQIEVTGGSTSVKIPLIDSDNPGSCTGFAICHDEAHCKIPVPTRCLPKSPGPVTPKAHVH